MINDVLDIASIESDRLELTPQAVHVAELINESIGLMRPLASARAIEIDIEPGQQTANCFVRADLRRLKQVLLNLLSNAIKYNRPGRADRRRRAVPRRLAPQHHRHRHRHPTPIRNRPGGVRRPDHRVPVERLPGNGRRPRGSARCAPPLLVGDRAIGASSRMRPRGPRPTRFPGAAAATVTAAMRH